MRLILGCSLLAAVAAASGVRAQAPTNPAAPQVKAAETDLDAFMARALQRRDVDRRTLGDYILDEVETFDVYAPGHVPVLRMRGEYTWFVQDGIHVRSPIKINGVPISDADRRKYEDNWIESEQERRKHAAEQAAKPAARNGGSAGALPPITEPRFISESYFMDFKFEPGNYYLAGHEPMDGHDVLKVDYYPTHAFADRADPKDKDASAKDQRFEDDIDRKMNKTSQITLWVDPATHQIVKYTFDNVWLDFLPAGWLLKVDDIKASMEMFQPFDGVWLPRGLTIRGGATIALGSMDIAYHRDFSHYRKADVTSRIRIPKEPR